MNKDNNLWYEESIVCSNPCAEYLAGTVFAGDYDSSQYGGACNLGSLMLHRFVEHPFTEYAEFNLYQLAQAVHTAVRFLDNIIDINTFPSEIYRNYQERYRTIGLGYTGLADALVMLGHRYDTQEARRFVSNLTEFIAYSAYSASVELAKEKGAFPGFCKEAFTQSGFLEKHRSSSELDWQVQNGVLYSSESQPETYKSIEAHESVKHNPVSELTAVCPECGAELYFEGGCNICKS